MISFSVKKLHSLRLVKSFAGKYSQCEHKIGANTPQTDSRRHSEEHTRHTDQFV